MDCSLPGSSIHGIFQARVLEWGAIAFSYKQHIQYQNSIKKPHLTKKWTEDLNRHSSKEYIQMANRHMKRCSTLLIIREMKIKTIVRYYLTKVRMTIIKKSKNNNCW